MKYILTLDYEHLDNGLFLTNVAQGLARFQNNRDDARLVVVHGESEYTERLIQTGIMREEATIRAIKDLNHRLVALFADQGVSAVGLNGYQRECITLEEGKLNINMDYIESLHHGPVLLLSNLVLNRKNNKPTPVPLNRYLEFLHMQFAPEELILFSKYDHRSPPKENSSGPAPAPPDDLTGLSVPTHITTTAEFITRINQNPDQ
ncbi:hypothetical protein ACG2F4_03975 [Halalkalibaculum sp. DA3122]|uniref:hypothetical protein n=1 Tax=Halalkalibaculum sp. DA3122 TaxID=3373607 RepID=UPI00375400E1